MNHTPIVVLVSSKDHFYSSSISKIKALLQTIAPVNILTVANDNEFNAVLHNCANDFYCKTIIAIGKVFYDSYCNIIAENSSIYTEQPNPITFAEAGIKYYRINHSKHLLLIYDIDHQISVLQNELEHYFSISDHSLLTLSAIHIGERLQKNNLTIASGESCTGGLITKVLTDVSGSSSYVRGGVCTYTAAMKTHILGVSDNTLATYGIVSSETAKVMARGVQRLFMSNIAISTTGVAGPGADSDGNPEGLVYIGLAVNDNYSTYKYSASMHTCLLDRDVIRKGCTLFSLKTIDEYLDSIFSIKTTLQKGGLL